MDSAGYYWYCGKMVPEPVIIGNRVSRYEYRVRHGCGELNTGSGTTCKGCGKERTCALSVVGVTSTGMSS